MAIRSEIYQVSGMEVRLYDFSTYATLWRSDSRLGYFSPIEGGRFRTEAGFEGSRQEVMEHLVQAHRDKIAAGAVAH